MLCCSVVNYGFYAIFLSERYEAVNRPVIFQPLVFFSSRIHKIYIYSESAHRSESENISAPSFFENFYFHEGKGGPLSRFLRN